MTTFRLGQLILLALYFIVFVYLVLALAEAGGVAGCHWAFPWWFGCVLYVHETLAAGGLSDPAAGLINRRCIHTSLLSICPIVVAIDASTGNVVVDGLTDLQGNYTLDVPAPSGHHCHTE